MVASEMLIYGCLVICGMHFCYYCYFYYYYCYYQQCNNIKCIFDDAIPA